MAIKVDTVVEPFVRRGLFDSPEKAVAEMARHYVLRQIEAHQETIHDLEHKYGMTLEQFEQYLQVRSNTLAENADAQLNHGLMKEEEDGLDWKIATEMLFNWLGLMHEVSKP